MNQVPVMPMMKRPAMADSKSGVPIVPQQNAGTSSYQQAAALQAAMTLQQQQQPFVPVTSQYTRTLSLLILTPSKTGKKGM